MLFEKIKSLKYFLSRIVVWKNISRDKVTLRIYVFSNKNYCLIYFISKEMEEILKFNYLFTLMKPYTSLFII